jgi:hypothetical protein
MARSKKTMDVKFMIDYSNTQLKRTDEFATKEFKSGICVMIEQILFRTENYKGFSFLDSDDSETGTLGYYSRHYSTSSKL